MAMSTHFFNKRDTEPPARHVVPLPQANTGNTAVHPLSGPESQRTNTSPTTMNANPASINSKTATSTPAPASGSKLTVGPNIKLKGVEITDCDTLLVEGLVEATMDSRLMEIAEPGAFKGSAQIDVAEIRGQFEGELTVRQKLTIYATGRVSGKIRYGKLVVEEGGQISGDVQSASLSSSRVTTIGASD
jgi:cytoskeletal protein CcmA (bactofilin family)